MLRGNGALRAYFGVQCFHESESFSQFPPEVSSIGVIDAGDEFSFRSIKHFCQQLNFAIGNLDSHI